MSGVSALAWLTQHAPGVALIELYAWMTEMMLYRLNQVPDRLYLKFLELMGIQQFGPTPARAFARGRECGRAADR